MGYVTVISMYLRQKEFPNYNITEVLLFVLTEIRNCGVTAIVLCAEGGLQIASYNFVISLIPISTEA